MKTIKVTKHEAWALFSVFPEEDETFLEGVWNCYTHVRDYVQHFCSDDDENVVFTAVVLTEPLI